MNKNILVLTILGVALVGSALFLANSKTEELQDDDNVPQLWAEWKKTYQVSFDDPEVDKYRMSVFADNLEFIKTDKTGTMGITKFFDLTLEEFASLYLTEFSNMTEPIAQDIDVDPTISINWVNEEKVTAVKNQSRCGSCWTFSATGAVESALIIANEAEQTINLSEQELIDCCNITYDADGCYGGDKSEAFRYIQENSITAGSNYPYIAYNGICNIPKTLMSPTYTISSYAQVSASTAELAQALASQPIAVSVDATNWGFYVAGVFSNCSMNTHDHAVLLVGLQDGTWTIKNSWGRNWGEGGYIRLKNGNTCGLANIPFYPIV